MKRIALLVGLSIFAVSSRAGDEGFERLLVPIPTITVHGANGSIWTSSLLVRSNGTQNVLVHGVLTRFGPPSVTVRPAETLSLNVAGSGPGPGAILRVDRQQVSDLAFSLRVQDVSRQSQTWGTEVPIIRASDLDQRPLTLIGIPTSTNFRTMLRVYDLASHERGAIRMRIFGVRPVNPDTTQRIADEKLAEVELTVPGPHPSLSHASPGYLEISEIARFVPNRNFDLLAIEISSITPGTLLWAFIAIVNNETQHLTLITPQ